MRWKMLPRMADGPAREEDIKRILQNVEDRVNQFRADVVTDTNMQKPVIIRL